jgi:hypothetical protein
MVLIRVSSKNYHGLNESISLGTTAKNGLGASFKDLYKVDLASYHDPATVIFEYFLRFKQVEEDEFFLSSSFKR